MRLRTTTKARHLALAAEIATQVAGDRWMEMMGGRPVVFPISQVNARVRQAIRELNPNYPEDALLPGALLFQLQDSSRGPSIMLYIIDKSGGYTGIGWGLDQSALQEMDGEHTAHRERFLRQVQRSGVLSLFERRIPWRFQWKQKLGTLADALAQVHSAVGTNLISDYHTKQPRLLPAINELTIAEALEELGKAYGSDWRLVKDIVVYRNRNWVLDDPKEVPNRLITRWALAMEKRGWLSLEEAVEIGRLTEHQLSSLCIERPEMDVLFDCWPFLRFVASLSPGQVAVARSAKGLDLDRLSVGQVRQLLQPYRNPYNRPGRPHWFRLATLSPARFLLSEGVEGNPARVRFRLEPAGPGPGYGVDFSLPRPPKRPEGR